MPGGACSIWEEEVLVAASICVSCLLCLDMEVLRRQRRRRRRSLLLTVCGLGEEEMPASSVSCLHSCLIWKTQRRWEGGAGGYGRSIANVTWHSNLLLGPAQQEEGPAQHMPFYGTMGYGGGRRRHVEEALGGAEQNMNYGEAERLMEEVATILPIGGMEAQEQPPILWEEELLLWEEGGGGQE